MIGGRCWSNLTAAKLDIQRCAPRDNLSDANERVTKLRDPKSCGASLGAAACDVLTPPPRAHYIHIYTHTGTRTRPLVAAASVLLFGVFDSQIAAANERDPLKRPHKRSFTSFA